MAIAAISNGTNAIVDPKTKASTMRAPRPPISVSASTLGPADSSSPVASTSRPVMRTGAPSTDTPAAAARAWSMASPAGSNATCAAGK